MKKTLVALAALAATSVFAQTTVTLDGYIDRGFLHTSNSNGASNYRGISSSLAGTTTLGVKVDEEISPDLNARVWISTDWADVGGATQDHAVNTTTNDFTGNAGGFANSQNYIELASKTFGAVKFGAVNSASLTAVTAVGAPGFSTAVGSTYSSQFSVHDGFNTGTAGYGGLVNLNKSSAAIAVGGRSIRMANTFQYQTPVVAGFQATLAVAAKNDNGAPGVTATNPNGTNNLLANRGAATAAVDTVGMKEGALRYTNGPLDLMVAKIQYVSPGTTLTYGGFAADTRATNTTYAGNLAVLPTLKVYAAAGSSRMIASTEVSSVDSKFRQYGVSFDVTPMASVWVQTAKVDDKTIADVDRKMTGVGANYMLSKRTRVFYRADRVIYNIENPDGIGNKQTRSALGLSHSF